MTTIIDTNTITGKKIYDVIAMGIDFGTFYPTVADGIVTGVVDGNYPNEFNDGNWDIINDFYAEANN